jgi:hypothetical protein
LSDPGDRPLPWAEMLLSLPLIAFTAYAAGVPGFPWGVVFGYWAIGAGIGYYFARSRRFRPFVGILAGMLVCFPVNLLFFLIDPRKPPPLPDPDATPSEEPASPPPPAAREPGRGLAKSSALLGVGGFLCWGLCGLAPILGLLLGMLALVLSFAKPERFSGRGLAAIGIAGSLMVGFLVFTGPVPRPTNDFMRWDSRTEREKTVVNSLRGNVGRFGSLALEDRPAPLGPEDVQRALGYSYTHQPGPDGAFAFLAVPIERRWSKRLREEWWRPPRAFCADDTGRICYTQGGPDPSPSAGRCPPEAACRDVTSAGSTSGSH